MLSICNHPELRVMWRTVSVWGHPLLFWKCPHFDSFSAVCCSLQDRKCHCQHCSSTYSTYKAICPWNKSPLHISEGKLKTAVETDTCDILWNIFEYTWRQFAKLEIHHRLSDTSTNHKKKSKTGSCSFIKDTLERVEMKLAAGNSFTSHCYQPWARLNLLWSLFA